MRLLIGLTPQRGTNRRVLIAECQVVARTEGTMVTACAARQGEEFRPFVSGERFTFWISWVAARPAKPAPITTTRFLRFGFVVVGAAAAADPAVTAAAAAAEPTRSERRPRLVVMASPVREESDPRRDSANVPPALDTVHLV